MPHRGMWLMLVASALPACAGYSLQDKNGAEGYVIYAPEPYVLVNSAGDGAKAEIVYLPNKSEPYRLRSWAGLGKADFEFDFENGWMLKGIHDKADNTDLLKTIASFIPKPAGASAQVAMSPDDQPHLYQIHYTSCGQVCGLEEIPVGVAKGCLGGAVRVPAAPQRAVVPKPAGPAETK